MPSREQQALGWMNASQLRGAAALVVGGGSGIGAAAARMLARERRPGHGCRPATRTRLGRLPRKSWRQVTKPVRSRWIWPKRTQIDAAVASTADSFGGIDVLVNTAAFVKAAPLDDGPLEEWDQSFRVNVEAALHLAQACLPHLKRSDRASIVLVASLAGVHGFPRGGGLRAQQGGPDHPDPPNGAGVGELRHPRQRGNSGLHRDAHVGRPSFSAGARSA